MAVEHTPGALKGYASERCSPPPTVICQLQRDALADFALCQAVDEQAKLRVSVDIDKTGSGHQVSAAVDDPSRSGR
ncbi:MAG: hypothetical protein Q8P31_06250 [Bacillota bacterium]|nr:hypothetical protein [Bacillota bacterium]